MHRLKVLQVLPELNTGGVERGTLDFARYLVAKGHDSWVMSAGGRLVDQLQREGSHHLTFPVHRKSLLSLLKVRALRRQILALAPDVVHVRSRLPAWLVWLALKNETTRPALVSTFHGLYSVSFYSEIMGCGDRVIAISNCVSDYIGANYPKIPSTKVRVIHRGVDREQFNCASPLPEAWRLQFEQAFPNSKGKVLIVMPGRLSPWKGQRFFIDLVQALLASGLNAHGLIVGGADPKKADYERALRDEVTQRGLSADISFLGHRADMEKLYKVAAVVVNVSQHAEPFGRTIIESLAVGTPVVAFNAGGPAEALQVCLPQALVPQNDVTAMAATVTEFARRTPSFVLPEQFTLSYQAEATLAVYFEALAAR